MKKGSKKNSKIKIKINGEEKLLKDGNLLSLSETAASSEPAPEESFDWVIPEIEAAEEKETESPYIVKASKEKKAKSFTFKAKKPSVWVSIALAVVVGTGLGYMALKTVTSKNLLDKDQGVPAAAQIQTPAEGKKTASRTAASALPSLNAYIVQGGIFSGEKGAKAAAASAEEKGVPAKVMEQGGNYLVILGAAGSLDDAKALSQEFKKQEVDAFWKEITLKSKSGKGASGDAAHLADLNKVYSLLAEKSSRKLLQQSSSTSGNALKEAVEKIEKDRRAAGDKLPQMEKTIRDAAAIYLSGTEEKKLEQTQQKLLDFLALYGE
ncbi:SPOR domain-containing protein [Peribacillus kribbensis]|uniref:SPOR domain-containing protein n=1 Tax=Peribacillus kribbensis TaxID=356658 RepID=UPI00041D1EC8|nr:SPOR domain-containing protein [Peribacillus kribbensis]